MDSSVTELTVERATTTMSPSIAAIAAALAKAQGEMTGAAKDKTNPHFKSAYADLASVWDACRAALSKNGLSVVQPVSADGNRVTVTTLLAHSSGEWISGELTMTAAQNTPQGIGSCITYARRYALASMVGVAPEDDDGNAASNRPDGARPVAVAAPPPPPTGFIDWLADMEAAADNGVEALRGAWKNSKPEYRDYATRTGQIDSIKAKAAKVPA